MINILLLSAVSTLNGIVEESDALRTHLSTSIAGVPAESVEHGWLTVRTTAYTHTESDHKKYGRKTASGTTLRYGEVRSAAADWSRFPVGTRFQIEDDPSIYVVEDYGSALVGKHTIDLYRPTRKSMNSWGARNVRIRILEWGSFKRSLKIMKGRTHHQSVRKMAEKIKRDDSPARRALEEFLQPS
ncbi:MAG: 3D domain-containing protein [Verrucomicrobiales bacterium]